MENSSGFFLPFGCDLTQHEQKLTDLLPSVVLSREEMEVSHGLY